jgi:hypothetical protein
MVERLFVRIFVAAGLCLALLAFASVPVPEDAHGNPALPAPAFEQVGLYRLEVSLLVFYGSLLLITPAFAGLTRARLPIEISTRGAKFAEEADQSAALSKAKIEKLQRTANDLADGLITANLEIQRLREIDRDDSRQQRVDSKR